MEDSNSSQLPLEVIPPAPEGKAEDNSPRELIEEWVKRVEASEAHWDKKFKRMRDDMDFARGKQWPQPADGDGEFENEDRYVANIVQRHLQQRVASLYAKNPRFIARRRKTLDFKVWDENPQTLSDAIQAVMQAGANMAQGMPPDPVSAQAIAQAQAIVTDAQQGHQRRMMLDKIGRTMEILFQNQISEQFPPFKKQMKQLIRRTLTTSVGWVKLGYERVMEPRPEDADKIRDLTTQLTEIDRLTAALGEDGRDEMLEVERQELAEMLRVLQEQPQQIVREGLVFDYPPATSVIPDKRCRQLNGFVGARFVAQRFDLPPSEVKRIYGVDVCKHGYEPHRDGNDGTAAPARGDYSGLARGAAGGSMDDNLVRVYEIQDKQSRTFMTVAKGCPVWLKAPAEPEVRLDRFWTLFSLTFNDIENETKIYPPSDVELMRHMQLEHNRARQALREHRAAAAPGYVSPRGALSDVDKGLLADRTPHETVELDGLTPERKVQDVLQALPNANIDPALYETNTMFDDIMKVNGVQEAQIGGTSGATATEVSTAEGARMSSVASNVDDLDDLFNELARAASQILLTEFDEATVKRIAGVGAVWPQLSGQDIADELLLEVEAGSSGKPNRAADIKNYMDMAPILMQIPGIKPDWLAREGIKRLDDRLDLTDAFLDGLPSIQQMSAAPPPSALPPDRNPNQQGGEGGNNAKRPGTADRQPNQQPAAGAAPNPGQAFSPSG